MPSYYDAVGVEPTYELAEMVIKAIIRNLKYAIDTLNVSPNSAGYKEYSLELLGYRRISRFTINNHERISAIHLIISHFPNTLIKLDNTLLIKDDAKHQLNADDLLIAEYYIILLNEYEERINKYQQYLKKQQDRQRIKLLLILLLPFIMFFCMLLVGD